MEIEEEFRKVCPDRLELMIDLPTDWPLEMESLRDERNFWPIRILKILARFRGTMKPGWDSGIPFRGRNRLPKIQN